jgi:tRNA(Ile)-lysidine synthase
LAPGSLVLVACSGGGDSIALAAAAAFEARRCGLRAGALTVDHQLQEGSTARAVGLARTLGELDLDPVEILTVQVGSRGGPEAAAREARYNALGEAAGRLDAAVVLLGHTRDDQAETVLLGLARGSGARSLAGMAGSVGCYRRPLLELPRAVVRAAAVGPAGEGLPVWEDPHNADAAFARARIRSNVMPVLENLLGPGVAAALARSALLLRADADALDALAERSYLEVADDECTLDVAALANLPDAVRTRVLRLAAVRAGAGPSSLRAGHIAAVDALLTAWHGQGPIDLPQGVRVTRSCGRLLIRRDVTREEGDVGGRARPRERPGEGPRQ